jgi:L-seryl-tRNA(Ser) seleniumtransferase
MDDDVSVAVVNNNAASVLLILSALASGREVLISRGELLEIGGGFRIPEIVNQGGAKLIEVGTTNKTTIRDYELGITPNTAVILKVHASNFKMEGFVHSPSHMEIAELCRNKGIYSVHDLGSGALVDLSLYGLPREPLVQDSIKMGTDIVAFSGDKLVGGPQCGIILGKPFLVEELKRHPLYRALRVDKITLAALQATITLYVRGEKQAIPLIQMLSEGRRELRVKAKSILKGLSKIEGITAWLEKSSSYVGGGSLPCASLDTILIKVKHHNHTSSELSKILRMAPTPIVGRTADGFFSLDVRSIRKFEVKAVLASIQKALL